MATICTKEILLKRSDSGGVKPLDSELKQGELAFNTYDGILYAKKDDGSIIKWEYDDVATVTNIPIEADGGNGLFEIVESVSEWAGTSSDILDNETAQALFILNANCELHWRVSSEQSYDWLWIIYDGTVLIKKSGIDSGDLIIDVVGNTGKQLEIKYTKDGSISNNSDNAEITGFRAV